MRALITGGNGFLGGELCRLLSSEKGPGGEVRALVRDEQSAVPEGVRKVKGSLENADSLVAAMEGVETVFHLAGLRRASERAPFIEVNAEGTRRICEAMLKTGARRLVLASSLAVHGPSSDRPHTEDAAYAPTEWYGESKVEAEKIALGYADRLEVVVLRPPRIMGPGDKENLPFFKIVQRGFVLELGGAPRKLSLVDVDDCARAFVIAAQSEKAPGQAFLLPGPSDVTLEEIQTEAARALDLKVRKVRVPQVLLRTLASAADATSMATGKTLALNRKLAKQLLAPGWTCSGQKAREVLGWTPRASPSESIARTAKWYREHRWI